MEDQLLAPYAAKSGESLGRIYPDPEDPFRTIFQRDRDRVIHCKAFRRLEYKTQVFVNHEGDHYRTRLTHSIEVAQLSRTIARALRLNEDLAEAIALAHDLGHTPFGHAGEHALNELMRDHGGFEHNVQSYRVVTKLEERYPDFPGLNLSIETLTGLAKHQSKYDDPKSIEISRLAPGLTVEAQIVNIADEIAYDNHDIDDGLRSGVLGSGDLEKVELWSDLRREVAKGNPTKNPSLIDTLTIKRLINEYVTDVITETKRRMEELQISSLDDVYREGQSVVGFSNEMTPKVSALKTCLFTNLYCHYRVNRMADKAHRILGDLFRIYLENPRVLPSSVARQMSSEDQEEGLEEKDQIRKKYRIICDYIAGMTDRFALDEHKKLFDPHSRV